MHTAGYLQIVEFYIVIIWKNAGMEGFLSTSLFELVHVFSGETMDATCICILHMFISLNIIMQKHYYKMC